MRPQAAIYRPVTPAIHKGWAPKKEKIKDAMKEDSRTSETPYCCVASIKCKENAIPGSTLRAWSTVVSTLALNTDHESTKGKKKQFQMTNSLCKENKSSCGQNSIIPRVLPVTPVPGGASTYVSHDARANFNWKQRS